MLMMKNLGAIFSLWATGGGLAALAVAAAAAWPAASSAEAATDEKCITTRAKVEEDGMWCAACYGLLYRQLRA